MTGLLLSWRLNKQPLFSLPHTAALEITQRAAGGQRTARLEQLESQVRSGGYRPDPSRVAEQILSDAEVDARIAAMLQR